MNAINDGSPSGDSQEEFSLFRYRVASSVPATQSRAEGNTQDEEETQLPDFSNGDDLFEPIDQFCEEFLHVNPAELSDVFRSLVLETKVALDPLKSNRQSPSWPMCGEDVVLSPLKDSQGLLPMSEKNSLLDDTATQLSPLQARDEGVDRESSPRGGEVTKSESRKSEQRNQASEVDQTKSQPPAKGGKKRRRKNSSGRRSRSKKKRQRKMGKETQDDWHHCAGKCDSPDSGLMICCDLCAAWRHIMCEGVTLEQTTQSPTFVCSACNSKAAEKKANKEKKKVEAQEKKDSSGREPAPPDTVGDCKICFVCRENGRSWADCLHPKRMRKCPICKNWFGTQEEQQKRLARAKDTQ